MIYKREFLLLGIALSTSAIFAEDNSLTDLIQSEFTPLAAQEEKDLREIDLFKKSENDSKFTTTETIELKNVKFDKNKLLVSMKKWGQIKINLNTTSSLKNKKWTDECSVKLYVGFKNCRNDGKMMMFKSYCDIATLPIDQEQSVLFFIPGDIRKKYGLSRVPDYCAIRFCVNGVNQKIKIVDNEGKEMEHLDSETFHKEMKSKSAISIDIMRNMDQLPPYSDIRISDHPTLLLQIN